MALLRFIVCWLLAGLADFLFLRDFFGAALNETGILGPLLFHLLGTALIFFSGLRGRTYAVLSLFLPVFGWLMSFVLFFASRLTPPKKEESADIDDLNNIVMPAKILKSLIKSKKSYRERVISELDFIPLIDIIRGQSDPELKRGAIEKLAQIKTPEAIDILLSLRSDASVEVRFYATSSLSRIKKEFDEQLEAAKQEMKKDVYKTSARLFLAKIYLRYSRSHLLDLVTTKAYEKEALFHLNTCAESDYVRDEDFWLLYEVYSSQKEWEKALQALSRLEARSHQQKNNKQAISQARIEIFYETGQYQLIPEKLSEMLKEGEVTPTWGALANWWGIYSL